MGAAVRLVKMITDYRIHLSVHVRVASSPARCVHGSGWVGLGISQPDKVRLN